jgi:hexulose-6-phosphate isomerase
MLARCTPRRNSVAERRTSGYKCGMASKPSRRTFIQGALAGALATQIGLAQTTKANEPRLKKALKYSAITPGNSPLEKFKLIKSHGFLGVEIDSPNNLDAAAILAAAKESGIAIHGTIDSVHWKKRLSDPDEKVRAEGLAALRTAIKDCKIYGGTTVLVVPGKVSKDSGEGFDEVWSRSQEQIRKAIPDAEDAGVKIAIEVVWNDFITKPEQLVKYVDEFKSKSVGAYFDISNMIKYGVAPADWIRALGPRMLKFDFKGFKQDAKPQWVKIGDGDENWPEVMKALEEVDYRGWATAEVGIPTVEELKDVSDRMDRCLGIMKAV